jgi:hypothetical protein
MNGGTLRPSTHAGAVESIGEDGIDARTGFKCTDIAGRRAIAIAIERSRFSTLVGGRTARSDAPIDGGSAGMMAEGRTAVIGERPQTGIDVELIGRIRGEEAGLRIA